jgi:cobaltochelatase CobN
MHVLFREKHGLDEAETPVDLGQDPADLVVLSFSDSDLGAFAGGWHRGRDDLPSLRLANLVALRHPLSVDTYIEGTLRGARGILIRLIGGESYWPYGLSQVGDLARRAGIALAVLPADGRFDARLEALSTVPEAVLRRLSMLCDGGGAVAAEAALRELARAAGFPVAPAPDPVETPEFGWYDPDDGVVTLPPSARPHAVVSFYRSYLTAADTGPVDALIRALRKRGFAAIGLFAASLKGAAARHWIAGELARLQPAAIVNATAFSGRDADGVSPLDPAGCPVFQVAFSTATRDVWAASSRGLSPADLAMHVVLPEVDGRIFAGVVSFKSEGACDPDLQFARFTHEADAAGVAAVADRVAAWHRLAVTPPEQRRPALVLSTYPG